MRTQQVRRHETALCQISFRTHIRVVSLEFLSLPNGLSNSGCAYLNLFSQAVSRQYFAVISYLTWLGSTFLGVAPSGNIHLTNYRYRTAVKWENLTSSSTERSFPKDSVHMKTIIWPFETSRCADERGFTFETEIELLTRVWETHVRLGSILKWWAWDLKWDLMLIQRALYCVILALGTGTGLIRLCEIYSHRRVSLYPLRLSVWPDVRAIIIEIFYVLLLLLFYYCCCYHYYYYYYYYYYYFQRLSYLSPTVVYHNTARLTYFRYHRSSRGMFEIVLDSINHPKCCSLLYRYF